MIRLRPIAGQQSFTVIPSSYSEADVNESLIYITDEETKEVYTYSPANDLVWEAAVFSWEEENRTWNYDENTATEGFTFTLNSTSNYLTVTLLSIADLKEGSRYRLEIKSDDIVVFRDTIFVLDETDKKKVYSYPNTYKQYDDGEDSYIVL